MPHSISAAKRVRQNLKRHAHNKKVKAELKNLTKKLLELINSKKKEEALVAFKNISSRFDKAAKHGVVHSANAGRHKSRLAQRLNKAFA